MDLNYNAMQHNREFTTFMSNKHYAQSITTTTQPVVQRAEDAHNMAQVVSVTRRLQPNARPMHMTMTNTPQYHNAQQLALAQVASTTRRAQPQQLPLFLVPVIMHHCQPSLDRLVVHNAFITMAFVTTTACPHVVSRLNSLPPQLIRSHTGVKDGR